MTAATVVHSHDTGLVQAEGAIDPPVLVHGKVCDFEAHRLVVTYRRTRTDGRGLWSWEAVLSGSTGHYSCSTVYTCDDDLYAVPDYVRNYILARHPEVSTR